MNKQFLDNEREIRFNVRSITGSHGAVPVNTPVDYYPSTGIGLAYVFSDNVVISLGYNGYFGKDRYKNSVINFGVGILF